MNSDLKVNYTIFQSQIVKKPIGKFETDKQKQIKHMNMKPSQKSKELDKRRVNIP